MENDFITCLTCGEAFERGHSHFCPGSLVECKKCGEPKERRESCTCELSPLGIENRERQKEKPQNCPRCGGHEGQISRPNGYNPEHLEIKGCILSLNKRITELEQDILRAKNIFSGATCCD